MQSLELYLTKFHRMERPQAVLKRATVAAILETMGIVVEESSVRVSGRAVFVSLAPAMKAEVYMRREEVVLCLESKLGGRRLPNIF